MQISNKKTKPFNAVPFAYHQELEIRITDITNLGLGVGRFDAFVVMVPYVLVGELVKVRIFKNNKNYSEADLLEVIEASPERITPPCPLFGSCGGCQYQHIKYEAQLALKRKQIKDLMQRIGGIDSEIEATHASPKTYGYRSKLTPHFERAKDSNSMPIGFVMQGRRGKLVDVPTCPIASDAINNALPEIRKKTLAKAASFKRGGTLLLRDALEGVITDNRQTATEKVGKLNLRFVAGEFFQNNPFILPDLLEYVVENAKGARYLVDAYCGVGGFALWAADSFEKVLGVEISENSIFCARENAKINKVKNCTFISGKAETIFADIPFKADETSVIIDPPRSGSDEIFLRQLLDFAPHKIVYVSCAPDTQARDLKFLTQNGYEITKLQPFDMFPQTRHIENVAVLEKIKIA